MLEKEVIDFEKSIIVGIVTQNQSEDKLNEYLDELEFLTFTAGGTVIKRFSQKMDKPNPKTFVECQACSLYNYCNAGCTHSQLVNGGMEAAKPVESVCSLFHMTYREAIRITSELKDNEIFKNIISNLSKGMG